MMGKKAYSLFCKVNDELLRQKEEGASFMRTSTNLPGGSAYIYTKGAEAEAYAMNCPLPAQACLHDLRKPVRRGCQNELWLKSCDCLQVVFIDEHWGPIKDSKNFSIDFFGKSSPICFHSSL